MLLSPNFGDYKFTHNFLIDNKILVFCSSRNADTASDLQH